MARPRRDYLQHTHLRLMDWGQWVVLHLKDAGYPHETVEARMMTGGAESRPPPGSRVPNVMMPEAIAITDRAVRQMPSDIRWVVNSVYLDGAKVSLRRLNEALMWVDGRLKS